MQEIPYYLHEQVYEPHEDSFLVLKHLKDYTKDKNVLEIGFGSGILSIESSKYAKSVTSVDINPHAIKGFQEIIDKHNLKNVRVKKSNMFSNLKDEKFDLIIFNPPYLPAEVNEPNDYLTKALVGGKKGNEIVLKFLEKLNLHLNENGKVLLLISTLTRPDTIEFKLDQKICDYKMIDECKLDFEKLFLYEIKKSLIQSKLENQNIKNVKYLTHGRRGMIFIGRKDNIKVGIKIKYSKSNADGKIENEGRMLEVANKIGIGPKLIYYDKDIVIYKFAEGITLENFVKTKPVKEIIAILTKILEECKHLDENKFNKEELQNPYRHIIIDEKRKISKITMLDFERSYKLQESDSKKPHNVTQFCQYLVSTYISELLIEKNVKYEKQKIIEFAKSYNNSPEEIYQRIKSYLENLV